MGVSGGLTFTRGTGKDTAVYRESKYYKKPALHRGGVKSIFAPHVRQKRLGSKLRRG
jgi:hypothetical protein